MAARHVRVATWMSHSFERPSTTLPLVDRVRRAVQVSETSSRSTPSSAGDAASVGCAPRPCRSSSRRGSTCGRPARPLAAPARPLGLHHARRDPELADARSSSVSSAPAAASAARSPRGARARRGSPGARRRASPRSPRTARGRRREVDACTRSARRPARPRPCGARPSPSRACAPARPAGRASGRRARRRPRRGLDLLLDAAEDGHAPGSVPRPASLMLGAAPRAEPGAR